MRRLGMTPPAEESWGKLWTANPAYRPEVPIGWVVTSGSEISGFIGNLPRQMWDGRRSIVARVPTSWAVDQAARSYSLQLLFQWLNQRDADLLLNTTASVEAAALLDRLRMTRVPCPSLGERSVWVVSYAGWMSGLLRRYGMGGLSFLGALAAPIDALRAAVPIPERSRRMEWRTEFGKEFDDLWKPLSALPVLQSVRDAANLQWAYGDALAARRAWLLVDDRDGLRGYAVFQRNDIVTMGLRRMRLVDLVALDGDPGPFMTAAIARCRRDRVQVLETTGFDGPIHDALSRSKSFGVKVPGWPAYFRTGDHELASRLGSAAGWHPTLYDGDSSLG